jgi:8-oxo-dGTP diphosphatase
MTPDPEPVLRYGAKALIFDVDAAGRARILCLRKQGDIGLYYVLPGGGQNPGELLSETLRRECEEELGAAVEVGRLRYVQEYIGDNHEFNAVHGGRHFVNLYFEARLLEQPGSRPMQPDAGQVGWDWLDSAKLSDFPFYPRALARALNGNSGDGPHYLGDSV